MLVVGDMVLVSFICLFIPPCQFLPTLVVIRDIRDIRDIILKYCKCGSHNGIR